MTGQSDSNTVHLTEREVERIRSTVQDNLDKRSELVGHPREPRDAHGAISQATGASLMQDMGNMTGSKGQDTLPALAVGQCYPPCTYSLEDLKPMSLAELRMETHHQGRKLTVKRASPVVTHAARSWTMVQDEDGKETERLEICLHKTLFGEEILESGTVFDIKEPYFTMTEEGEATIRIDHPSDLVARGNEVVETGSSASAEANAKKCKDMGNQALMHKKLPKAWERYTEALKFAKQNLDNNQDLARDISRNRAHVNLLLNRLDEAMADAKAALIGREDQRSQELDSKAYFRAGTAAYNLGEYQTAKGFFEKQLELAPEDKGAKANLRRVATRLKEQTEGTYDLKKIRAALSPASPRADAASFINRTEIRDSEGRGRGLFAARDIPAGEIVLLEKASCVVWGNESDALTGMTYDVRDNRIRVSPLGLTKAIVQRLLNNPSRAERVADLYGDYRGNGGAIVTTNEGPVVDVFRIHDIVSRNAFGADDQHLGGSATKPSTGLWVRAAYINHSCVPNAKREFVGDLMVVRALRNIAAGEELFHSYDESGDYDARQEALMTTWGFKCECPLCVAEKNDEPATRKKRRELAAEADDFVSKTHWANNKRLVILKAQRLARAIDDTYASEKYDGLPHPASHRIREWLSKASK
ncbi:TPR domain-containing protein [Colletotrichum truncatum]|uniref:TPR domain-containing protein n=1 Tax=Colletotrichum truncatum TaxID=5467 RepID=A0ACC3ZKS3_COLTU|nr:TPR domain-containing protein [Colletotrichum truncatum]KAF6786855.1 TPR domain-containing protein [Colletotrichum truncatum]